MARSTKLRRRIMRILMLVILLFLFLPLVSFLMPSGMNRSKTAIYFVSRHIPYKDTILISNGRKLRFVSAGNDTMPMLLFIHGSPGSWDAFKDYLSDTNLLKKAWLVAVDRPGYGQSDLKGEASLSNQAACIANILGLRKNTSPVTLLGHSYGGPVALLIAMLTPQNVKQVILMAPTISPDIEEGITWKRNLQNMSKWWIWRWSLSRDLQNSTIEMQPLPDELRRIEPLYNGFRVPVLEIHGTEDPLAPRGNQDYVMQQLKDSKVDTVMLQGQSHFIPWTMKDRMVAIILSRL